MQTRRRGVNVEWRRRAFDPVVAETTYLHFEFCISHFVGYFRGGCAGRISTRLGKLLVGWATRSTITCATSSGSRAPVAFVSARPPNPVLTDPGSTYATRIPS